MKIDHTPCKFHPLEVGSQIGNKNINVMIRICQLHIKVFANEKVRRKLMNFIKSERSLMQIVHQVCCYACLSQL